MLGLEANPLLNELRWVDYWRKTVPYFAYLNDQDMPPFIDSHQAEEFVYFYSIRKPVGDLVRLWQTQSVVHTSITALTHEGQEAFQIEWSVDISAGVSSFDVYARGFCQGMLYPNIGMTGLRDFAHIKTVRRTAEPPGAAEVREQVSFTDELTEREGYAAFTRSIAETLMLALHAAILKGADDELIVRSIKKGLVDILEENGGRAEYFSAQWESKHFGEMLYEVKSAMITDRLRLQRFIQTAECFVLSLERLM